MAASAVAFQLGALAMLLMSRKSPPGIERLFLSLPAIVMNLCIPSLVGREQVVARACLAGQYLWWSNFKIIAFCCGRGPLVSEQCRSAGSFLLYLTIPATPATRRTKARSKTKLLLKLVAKTGVLALVVTVLVDNHFFENRWVNNIAEAVGLYTLLGVVEDSLPLILGIQVERSFNWFFLSASLAEFWSFRWNHHVAGLLKNVVYEPIVQGSFLAVNSTKTLRKPPMTRRVLAIAMTFLASGIMHEIVFGTVTGTVTGSWVAFFTLQGFYVILERALLDALKARGILVPKLLSIPVTLTFLLVTAEVHFFEPVRATALDKAVVNNLNSILNKIYASVY